MGRRGGGRGAGGGGLGGCALLAGVLVVSTLVIQGAGGTYYVRVASGVGLGEFAGFFFPVGSFILSGSRVLGCSCSLQLI